MLKKIKKRSEIILFFYSLSWRKSFSIINTAIILDGYGRRMDNLLVYYQINNKIIVLSKMALTHFDELY